MRGQSQRRGQTQCLPTPLPQVRHARQQRKAALVAIQHINTACLLQCLLQCVQLAQSALARGKTKRRRRFGWNTACAAIRATVFPEQAFDRIPMHFHAPFFSSSSTTALRLGVGLETACNIWLCAASSKIKGRPLFGASAKKPTTPFCQSSSQSLTVSRSHSKTKLKAQGSRLMPRALSNTACARCRSRWLCPLLCKARKLTTCSSFNWTNFINLILPENFCTTT